MRLISQNGNVDIPYDKAHILCNMECVMARVGNYEYILGKYSDKAKALTVMEMLRKKNFWDKDVFKFPADEEVEV